MKQTNDVTKITCSIGYHQQQISFEKILTSGGTVGSCLQPSHVPNPKKLQKRDPEYEALYTLARKCTGTHSHHSHSSTPGLSNLMNWWIP